jgi:phosphomannomutase
MATSATLFDAEFKKQDSPILENRIMTPHQKRIDDWESSGKLSESASQAIRIWLTESPYEAFRDDIARLIDDQDIEELEDGFRVQIAFGTGGIRGKMGAGPNRINLRTIGEAAQGLAKYVLSAGGQGAASRGIAIAFDTRNNSDIYAREVASIAAGNGITAHIFGEPRATPELSFAVRELGASAGVVISASHNPPRDNGFKVYWSDGGQVVAPHDKAIIAEVNAITEIKRANYDDGISSDTIRTMPTQMDATYIARTALPLGEHRDVKIVFSPLHGVGATSIVPALSNLGFNDLTVIDKQNDFAGNFPTMLGGVANPEDPVTMSMAIAKAREIDADLVLASDPDADRLGCAVPLPGKIWDSDPADLALNGNQIGVLLCHHLLRCLQTTGQLPPGGGTFATTIVTTDLTASIARSFGLNVVDNLLVGFKYIAQVIADMSDPGEFLFGTEESHGYLATHAVRDKDAASAAMILADCTATVKSQGATIREYLDDIYAEFGYYREIQKSVTREGASGSRDIQLIMKSLRESPPSEISGRPVALVIDRLTGTTTNPGTGETESIPGEKGNVLAFTFADAGHTRVTARPSGTEPKIKYYASVTSQDLPDLAADSLATTKQNVDQASSDILDGIVKVAEATLAYEVGNQSDE